MDYKRMVSFSASVLFLDLFSDFFAFRIKVLRLAAHQFSGQHVAYD